MLALDSIVKILAVLGIVTLSVRTASSVKLVRHPGEYLWFLLGGYVLCQPIKMQGLVLVLGGLLIAYCCRNSSWKWFYLFVAVAPVFFGATTIVYFRLAGPTNNYLWIVAFRNAAMAALAIGFVSNSQPTRAALAGVLTQLGLALVPAFAALAF